MNKPIYRYLAHRKWCSMERKIILQRIEQFHIVPDLLPKFEPVMDVKMTFLLSQAPSSTAASPPTAPTLRMQTDSFKKRLHFLATNIPWNPTSNSLPLTRLGSDSAASGPELGALAVPWLPAFAQKGAPYHRLNVFVLQHSNNAPLDAAKLKELYDAQGREGFSLKSFRDKFGLTPVGFTMFRSVWDENTADVMARHGLPGADLEFKQPRVMSLKPPRKARGWEAKRQKPKYRSLWKYTKRIKGLKY
ncbi:hypothetical protein NEMBOFW57_005339 [Staphylotrichum longicolle]|uniref:Uncharacterized protein n=1 Tax=Staphylotrichum longicolle TaxID=669026 RepID=A0AAD4HVZ0_9PEZI|nr:hypothetical protein NEMBOFW57_005339 [Staphylotrichum longicolle]